MELDVVPPPSDEERAAIAAALVEEGEAVEPVPVWAAAVAPGADDPASTPPLGA